MYCVRAQFCRQTNNRDLIHCYMQQSFNMTYEHGKEGASMAFSLIFWGGRSYRPELTLSGRSGPRIRRPDISNINFLYPSSHVCIPVADREDCRVTYGHAESGIPNHINSIRRSFLHTDISVLSGAEKSVSSDLENCIDTSGQKTTGYVLTCPESGIVLSAYETAGSVLFCHESSVVPYADATVGVVLTCPERGVVSSDPKKSVPFSRETAGSVLSRQPLRGNMSFPADASLCPIHTIIN